MKKTISVKYQGAYHHVVSYYSLEDVVSGKLKRPFQDPRLKHVRPRSELLTGWKVSLEREEEVVEEGSHDVPLTADYTQQTQSGPVQHPGAITPTQPVGTHAVVQAHGRTVQQHTSSHHSPLHYSSL